ncbi:type I polyketide synthase [Cylindrospermum sp. FACHB-282]|uniref:type I polyketide synthase n=1 Tax=Cylindrospermum sp. FACHB-282 TaxID=2692794 RepID=UPI001688FFFC|nr:type I polyketide synthase [Cylindrospermum sp. FACHB-282]MBD2385755.1 acyltransferase domain-containing protein [Cylindrospermum sp. FACHB-282]
MNTATQTNLQNGSEIAIIGLSGRFPGAKNIDEFWHNLQNGVESIDFFNEQELLNSGINPEVLKNPRYVKARAVLKDVELFDAAFFGFNPREAEITDPQHRLFLECAWESLENAGYDSETYKGTIGAFAGSGLSSYLLNICLNQNLIDSIDSHQLTIAGDKDFLTTRVAYKLNLEGPSYTIQTACSTSLVAVHLACQSLLNGECDMALAGGVSISSSRKAGYVYKEGGIHSPDGHCRAFDAKAQGTVGGEGVGIVVLKRLEDALADGDSIQAVIKGSAVNNDGSFKVSYTAPRIEGQAKVIQTAQAIAEVEAETITYIEAHGTATSLGDPIEIAALTQAFRASTQKKSFCAIGSVKTNIGHLDTAAGVTGLIKTVLALKHQQIPPSLHFEQPNPQIDFANSPFYVNTSLSQWQVNGIPRRAGVSSFGIGGTNAHVILEEAPVLEASSPSRPWQLLLLSAKTDTALETATKNLADYLQQQPNLNLADVAHTLAMGRRSFEHRRMLVCENLDDAVKGLKNLKPPTIFTPTHRPVVFMFPGQGSQYVNMGRELDQTEPIFRQHLDCCCELLKPHLGLDLRDVLYPSSAETAAQQLTQTAITQPVLFAIEYALAKLWMAWGVVPEAMIGHSIGEYVAATIAGVFSLADALAIVATRGQLMQQLPKGAMLSVQLPESEIQPLLGETLSLAARNAPGLCVVAGCIEAVEELAQQLDARGVACRQLHTSHAFHSLMMDSVIEPFTAQLQKVQLSSPQIPFISNVTGTWITTAEATDPDYWARHLRQPVRFEEGIAELLKQPKSILLEVGPGRTLSRFVQQHQVEELMVLTSIRHPQEQQSDVEFLLKSLGQLWLAGVKIDWSGVYIHEKRRHLPLPTYPFERQGYWIELQKELPSKFTDTKKLDIADWFYIPSWKRSLPPISSQFEAVTAGCCLLFVDECGLGEKMAQRLELQGQDVIIVRVGEQFSGDSSPPSYTINPGKRDDYDALFKELRLRGKIPQRIVHLWSVTADIYPDGWERDETLGFYSLLYLTQALGEQNFTMAIAIAIVSNNMQEVTGSDLLYPEKALILGACQVVPLEYPNISCRSIDVLLPASASSQEAQLVEWLVAELTLANTEKAIAYRGHHRWVQTFEPVQLNTNVAQNPRLRQQGVYLITGGLGGVGLALAEYLAQTLQAKLILIGRSAVPHRDDWPEWLSAHHQHDSTSCKIRQLQHLEALGAQVMVATADVANTEQMSAVLKQAHQQFGQIHGVIHAAAVPGGGMIQLKTADAAADALAPKVKGTRVLDALFQNTKLDFFILCSSLNSFLGVPGMVDYIAENAFLDAFAHYSTAKYNDRFITSINWDRWENLGMAVAIEARHQGITGQKLAAGITLTEGIDAFRRILLSSPVPQVIVSSQNFQHLVQRQSTVKYLAEKLAQLRPAKPTHPRPKLENAYVAPQNEVEGTLSDLWQKLLSIEKVGIHDNFFELGGDSLFATQLVSQMCKIFQVELSYKNFFNQPTIAELAVVIVQKLTEQASEAALFQALAEIEQLSQDEAQKILARQEAI